MIQKKIIDIGHDVCFIVKLNLKNRYGLKENFFLFIDIIRLHKRMKNERIKNIVLFYDL